MKEKILVINTQWPEEACPVQAATLVNYQLISELAKREGLRIGYLKVSLSGESEKMNDIQKDAQNNLESIGVTYLAPLKLPKFRDRRTKIMRLLRPKLSDYYPITQHRSIAYNAAKFHELLTTLPVGFKPQIIVLSVSPFKIRPPPKAKLSVGVSVLPIVIFLLSVVI